MWRFILKVIILGGLILGLAHIIPGLDVPNYPDALLFALIVAIFNATIAPVLIVISFPITVMTVGLFALLINVFLFWVASLISYGIHITEFWGAFWGGIIVCFASFLLNFWLSKGRPRFRPPTHKEEKKDENQDKDQDNS